MIRKPVKSSNIKSVGYDSASQTLEVEFHGGNVHQYAGVPAAKHAKLMAAKSVGKLFHSEVRAKHKSKQVA